LLMSFFDPGDGGDTFLWNVSWLPADYITIYPRRQNFSLLGDDYAVMDWACICFWDASSEEFRNVVQQVIWQLQ
jgi:hypothetical protein